jgi:signal peptidase I
MLPTLEGGDLIVIQNVPISEVKIGDIIVYNSLCSNNGQSVVHRVVSIESSGLITKGDANTQNDQTGNIAKSPIVSRCLEGKAVFVVPYLELLAYTTDAEHLPQWFNYLPSIIILIIVLITIFLDGKHQDRKD